LKTVPATAALMIVGLLTVRRGSTTMAGRQGMMIEEVVRKVGSTSTLM
jgi:hypothetical protein